MLCSEYISNIDKIDELNSLLFNWMYSDLEKDNYYHICSKTLVVDLSPTPVAYTMLIVKVDLLLCNSPKGFSAIFDSAVILTISPSQAAFVGPIAFFTNPKCLGGIINGMKIADTGNVQCSFVQRIIKLQLSTQNGI